MHELRIVDADPAHEDAIQQMARLVVDGFRDFWPEAWPDLPSALEEVREALEPGKICRAALEADGRVAGWVGAMPAYRGRVWELHPLVVREDLRGRGIGRALVDDLAERAREAGGNTLWLGTDDEAGLTTLGGIDLYPDPLEKLRSLRNLGGHPYSFYERLGFVVAGVLPDANGFGKPDIYMARPLR